MSQPLSESTLAELQYELLDSGDERKVERFGQIILIRPYRRAIWGLARPLREWQKEAHAEYDPDSGWREFARVPASWTMHCGFGKIILKLQKNSQIGLFPEHLFYLPATTAKLTSTSEVLNLFAYTGAASVFLRSQGVEQITHIDTSKSALSWANENWSANGFSAAGFKLIPEDAIKYLDRCIKREEKFDLIITDPPSFSRTTQAKNKEWLVVEVLESMIDKCLRCLTPEGSLLLTSHQLELDPFVLHNLLSTRIEPTSAAKITSQSLVIKEKSRDVSLSFGAMVLVG